MWKNAASLDIYLNVDLVYGRRKNSFCMIRMRDEGVVEEAKSGGLYTYIIDRIDMRISRSEIM